MGRVITYRQIPNIWNKSTEKVMAAIDKIYGSTEEYDEFRTWMRRKKPEYLKYFYRRDDYRNHLSRPITNLPTHADRWLVKNCCLDWVVDRIKEQYNGRI